MYYFKLSAYFLDMRVSKGIYICQDHDSFVEAKAFHVVGDNFVSEEGTCNFNEMGVLEFNPFE